MNITKVRNSAAIVNYVKPGMEMVEIEIEGSLLLTASDPKFGTTSSNVGQFDGTDTSNNRLATERR